MRCINPYVTKRGYNDKAYGCGQCMPCRVNAERIWFHRLLLEAFCHDKCCFVTLTYREEELPSDRSLSPEGLRNFLKRLRKHVGVRLRYFAAGEYGERTGRPHYHLVIYGMACGQGPVEWTSVDGSPQFRCGCYACCALRRAWPYGFVSVGALTLERAKYVCGYVLKKMTRVDDDRLCGRYPEFARMSQGLGKWAMADVASAMLKYNRKVLPRAIGTHGKSLPLGRYLRRKLAEMADVEVSDYKDTGLLEVRRFAQARSTSVQKVYSDLWSEYEASLSNKVRLGHEKKQAQAFSL